MRDVRIATRASSLAMAQAALIGDALRSVDPDLEVTLVRVTTSGDRNREAPVTGLSEVGAFVGAVQEAVLDGRADLAVHSSKDLPVAGPDLATFYPERSRPWDVLCGGALPALAPGARVGTGSPRRAAQLARLRGDLSVVSIRGNVDTRLSKVEGGAVDAVVLAEAGLLRLSRAAEIDQRFSVDEMVPAPGQGALAVQVVGGSGVAELAAAIEHEPTRLTVEAERLALAMTGAGCRAAFGALATVAESTLSITGFVEDERGARRGAGSGDDARSAVEDLLRELAL
jgi:hydroxymethylbilane synthase